MMLEKLSRLVPVVIVILLLKAGLCYGGTLTSAGETVYVPVYSHICTEDRQRPFNLAVTLSVRNTDPAKSMSLTSVDY